MARRARVGSLWGLGLALALGACSGGDDTATSGASGAAPADPAALGEREVLPEAQYQFVPTPDGMVLEAVSEEGVQSFSCPTRNCAGLCDECAARACRAAGELGEACAALVTSCNTSCRCGGEQSGAGSCGFPVCAADRMICYVGDEEPPAFGPDAPGEPGQVEPANPFGPASPSASRPSY